MLPTVSLRRDWTGSITTITTITMSRQGKVQGARSASPGARAHASVAVAPVRFPDDVVDRLVRELVAARGDLAAATSKPVRRRAEHRVRVLHATVSLLNQLQGDDVLLERAGKGAAKLLKALKVRDLYSDGDGRGNAAGKRMLRTVMEETLKRLVLKRDEITRNDALAMALARAGQELRAEQKPMTVLSGGPATWPFSMRLAFDFHTSGMCDDAAKAIFGSVPDAAIVPMAHAVREYAQGLDQDKVPQIDDLCTYALWGAGLLTVKDRNEFFDRLA